jgi:hypothetical protein
MKKLAYLLVAGTFFLASCGSEESESKDDEEKKEGTKTEATISTDVKLGNDVTNGEGVLLRLTPTAGSVMESTVDMNMKMDGGLMNMDTKMAMEFSMKVDTIDTDGIISVTSEYSRMKMKMNMPQGNVDYDSNNPESDDPITKAMADAMSGMIHTPFTMKMNGRSEMVEAPDFSTMFESNPAAAGQADQLKQTFDNMFAIYPENKVKLGDSWDRTMNTGGQMPMDMDATYTVKEILDDKVVLAITGKVKSDGGMAEATGTFTGTMEVDRATGFPFNSKMNQDISVTVQGMEMDMKVDLIMDTKMQ